jgi:hypothetical protein
MRTAPMWKELEALAPTPPHDIDLMGDFTMPTRWPASITMPALVVDGGQSLHWWRNTAQVVADSLPAGRRLTMDGHPHDVDPEVLGPIVERFVGWLGHENLPRAADRSSPPVAAAVTPRRPSRARTNGPANAAGPLPRA